MEPLQNGRDSVARSLRVNNPNFGAVVRVPPINDPLPTLAKEKLDCKRGTHASDARSGSHLIRPRMPAQIARLRSCLLAKARQRHVDQAHRMCASGLASTLIKCLILCYEGSCAQEDTPGRWRGTTLLEAVARST